MPIEFGLSLPAGPPSGQPWRFIADLDASLPKLQPTISSLWMTDHFFWEDAPTFEAWTVLSYLAARYPDTMVGPIVLGQGYRNPALVAKMSATLQTLTGGRLVMAIGAGWKEDEYRAYGYDYPSPGVRVAQLGDVLEIITRLWKVPGKVTYEGLHYSVYDAICEPKPEPIPTLMVGGGGEKTMLLAARFADIWNIPDASFNDYMERMAILDQHCETIGRDPGTLRRSWFGRLVVGNTAGEVAERGGRWTRENALAGTPEQVIEQVLQFVEAGVDHFVMEMLGLPDEDVIGLIAEEVLPHVTNRSSRR
jgi:alkanesulfonate monooxygenase SsuD/methylene tetrahydromethanopterin reductase-like flavin-dependent oxidoreductase (luciferase family)